MQRIRTLLSLRLPQNIYFSYALKSIRTAVLSELKVPYSCSPSSILPSGHAVFRASCSSFTSSDASDRDQFAYSWLTLVVQIADYQAKQKLMETDNQGQPCQKWKKKAYGGIQPGYPDNHTDSTFLQEMITNANVVKRDLSKAILDSISISQYVSIVSLVVSIWTHTLNSKIDEHSLLKLDICLLALGFSVLLVTAPSFSLQLLIKYFLNISFFTSGLYVLAPVYHTLTRSISSDSILALTVSLLVIHLFLHDYSGSTIRPPGALNNPKLASNISLNASIVASVLIASRLPSRLHVFAIMLFSLQVFLFAPLVMFCVKKYSFRVHLGFSFVLVGVTLAITYQLHRLFFGTLLVLIVFISVICPYWLIRIQEYKFEINGPWDEAKLCFDISE